MAFLIAMTGLVAVLAATAPGATAQFRPGMFSTAGAATKTCPIGNAKKNFDLSKFLGDWYVLEYQYPKEMRMKDISCVGLHYSLTGFGDLQSNFTFRFPAKTGQFYHVPTFSLFSQVERSVWETQFRGVELVSAIIDTDYDSWAVLTQCSLPASGSGASGESDSSEQPKFLSTRVLSRSRNLGAAEWIAIQAAISAADAAAQYAYPVEQGVCSDQGA